MSLLLAVVVSTFKRGEGRDVREEGGGLRWAYSMSMARISSRRPPCRTSSKEEDEEEEKEEGRNGNDADKDEEEEERRLQLGRDLLPKDGAGLTLTMRCGMRRVWENDFVMACPWP